MNSLASTSASPPASQNDIAKWDPNMAAETAVADANGVKWIDGKDLPIEGRVFDDVEHWYDRLPANVSTNVNAGVRGMKHHTAGMQFRFQTDSKKLRFKWTPWNTGRLAMGHMPSTGVSGIDIYRWNAGKGRWVHVKCFRLPDEAKEEFSFDLDWKYGGPCLVYLPLYNGLRSFSLGIDAPATVEPLPPRASGVEKPVVFYGTSITQGACASRPGMSFVNIVGRDLDVPVVNLGFAGNGWMELEMSEHLACIDASCYVLDCLWNMGSTNADNRPGRNVEENYEPFIRNLRAKRPGVPIVMAGQCSVRNGAPNAKERFVKALHDRLVAEGWQGLVFLTGAGMFADDSEGTVDGVHPNDHGMMSLAKAYGAAVAEALGCRWDDSSPAHLAEVVPIRVATYNIRQSGCDRDTPNAWDARKGDLVALVRKLAPDVFGCQEVLPDQAEYLRETLTEFAFAGEHRNKDRVSGEASPVLYRKDRFKALDGGTFWLSETPDDPGSMSWDAAYPRICSWVRLRDRRTGGVFCFANTHTDNKGELARKEGLLLVLRRMREMNPPGTPVVLVGDFNCRENEGPVHAVAEKMANALYASETPPSGPWRTANGWHWNDRERLIAEALALDAETRNLKVPHTGRIDHIFVSDGVKVRSFMTAGDPRPGMQTYPSDHFPVVSVLELPQAETDEK